MSATDRERTLEAPASAGPPGQYDSCEQCGAPVEANQRYCVVCGTRRKHVYDPTARFLTEATSRSRSSRTSHPAAAPKRRSPGLGLALALAAIPLAVAAGVLIGRPSNDASSKLLSAIRAQKPTVVNVVGGGGQTSAAATPTTASAAGPAAPTPVARLTSDFGLQHGYTVELQTLPGSGTTEATVAAAERGARARGATDVGLISQADFQITPAPPPGDYVIYSGQYQTSAEATAALAKLRHGFPAATVISVRSVNSAASGKVLATTSYGSAHQVSGFKATPSQLAAGGKIANQVSKEINGNYVKSQQGLPDAISVP